MKAHTTFFKENIKQLGRELDNKITYQLDGETIELGSEVLNSVTPHYEGSILKSVMKQLDIDSNVEIPKDTIINYQLGLKVNDEYEYLNYGNYVVYSIEEQKDNNSYKIICYDKMIYSMVDYEALNIQYPITIKNYMVAICNKLGLSFANAEETFANYNKQIQTELFLDASGNSLNYTFRDVLDNIAQVTASTICINENDEIEIRYINNTSDTIDEEYLKDINVNFGEKYGPVNSIVLSRSQGSDNVYIQDEISVQENGLCEIKIKDNQIMNFNDRSEYLPDILGVLNGFEYYLNDFTSTGICYYDLCDRYNVVAKDETYNCVMFNDSVQVTQGLQEIIYTEKLEEAETDYTKADKTDRKINQTYLIVDKQNQQIQSMITNITEQNNKISQITQTVDEINSKISDIADITISGESTFARFTLQNINQSEPITVKIHPISQSITCIYPHSDIYPSNTTYLKTRKLVFENYTTGNVYEYDLPADLLLYDSTHYDEFYLDYDSKTCQITKRCQYNADGTISLLQQEETISYPYPTIELTDGDYNIYIDNQEYGYIFARLMVKNIYTTQFATKVEVNTAINQTAQDITLEVDRKTSTDELISKINLKPGEILLEGTVTANQNFKILKDGSIVAKNGSFTGNIYLESGNKIVGGDGLYSNLTFITAGEMQGWERCGFATDPNLSADERPEVYYADCTVDYFIPENFTIERAYAILDLSLSEAYYSDNTGTKKTTGRAKQVKLYNGDDNFMSSIAIFEGGTYIPSITYERDGQVIPNCWASGAASITDNSTVVGTITSYYTNDIAKSLKVGKKQTLFARSTISKPAPIPFSSGGYTYYNFKNIVENTEMARMRLFIFGYMSVPE